MEGKVLSPQPSFCAVHSKQMRDPSELHSALRASRPQNSLVSELLYLILSTRAREEWHQDPAKGQPFLDILKEINALDLVGSVSVSAKALSSLPAASKAFLISNLKKTLEDNQSGTKGSEHLGSRDHLAQKSEPPAREVGFFFIFFVNTRTTKSLG